MIKPRNVQALLLLGTTGVLACDTLYGLDTPRPALSGDDTFTVTPRCADLPVDPSGLALVPTVITMTGRRAESGLGAESVPVSVSVGPCQDEGSMAEASAGAAGQAGAGGSADGTAPSCTTSTPGISALDAAQFELTALEARGCRQRSPSLLDCTLDPSGEAAFGVLSRLQDQLNVSGSLLICVSPLALGAKSHEKVVAVVPRIGASRVALAVVQLDGDEAVSVIPPASSCESVLDCDRPSARARLQAGVVSRDIPTALIRRSDLRPVTRRTQLAVALQTLKAPASGGMPYLSLDPNCEPSADESGAGGAGGATGEGDPALEVQIAAGQSASDVFYLCAPGSAADAELTASLIDTSAVAPFQVPREVTLNALTTAYRVETQGDARVLASQACGEAQRPVAPGALPVQPALSSDGQRVLVSCPAEPSGASGASDAGGAAGAGPSPNPTMAEECSIQIDVGSSGTCTLEVRN